MSEPDLHTIPLAELPDAIRAQTAKMDSSMFLTVLVMNAISGRLDEANNIIMELETRCDPSGDVQTIASLREQVGALQTELEQTRISEQGAIRMHDDLLEKVNARAKS